MLKKIFIIIALSVTTSSAFHYDVNQSTKSEFRNSNFGFSLRCKPKAVYGEMYSGNTKNPQTPGGTTFYYGKNGAYLGSSQNTYGVTTFKDETGRFTGKSQTLGSSTFYNGQTGNYLGRSQKYDGSTMYFNQRGGFTGSSRP